MKKLLLFMVMLAVSFAANTASADRVYVPQSFHYGFSNNNYTQLYITNLSSEAVSVTATWLGGSLATWQDAATNLGTNYLTSKALGNTALGAGKTWCIESQDTNIFGSTTSMNQGQISIQSSGTDDPQTGPIRAWSYFVNTTGSSPVGFMFPSAYRTVTWTTGAGTGNVTSPLYHWKQ